MYWGLGGLERSVYVYLKYVNVMRFVGLTRIVSQSPSTYILAKSLFSIIVYEVMRLPNTGIVKYHVKLKFEVDGLVEKADIIGAIFGQTEGLLGPEMNLNELQKVSKVGRIEVNVDSRSNMARGMR